MPEGQEVVCITFFKIKYELSLISCNEIRLIKMDFSKPKTWELY